MKKFCILVLAIIVALAFAGCGSSSSGRSKSDMLQSLDAYAQTTAPSNGAILDGSSSGNSGIEVKAPSSKSVYVKVVKTSGSTQVGFYVAAGNTASVNVPSGSYAVHFAIGQTWYGKSNRFGNDTSYGQDNSLSLGSGDVMSYTLSVSSGGNWNMGSLSASNF